MNEWESLAANTKLEMIRVDEVVFKIGDTVGQVVDDGSRMLIESIEIET